MWPLIVAIATLIALATLNLRTGRTEVVSVPYSFSDEDSGGAAIARIDIPSGRILSNEALFDSRDCREPLKIRRSSDGKTVAVTNLDAAGPQLMLWSTNTPNAVKGVSLPSIPDEVRLVGPLALLTLEDDAVVAVDLTRQQVAIVHELDKMLKPPANAPEDLAVDPSGEFAVVSFQKDSSSGKKKGNRLVIFKLPEFTFVADLPLPRERPDLHVRGNPKEQGPGPEVLWISPQTDTLAVTLDLYGAVGLLRWSDAKVGKLASEDWTMISTDASAELTGQSFPDRATSVVLGSREYYLVCNAGQDGGSVLIDLLKRKVVWQRPTPPGLEAPVFIPQLRQAFSVCSGKTKRRQGKEIIKTSNPQKSLYIFDFHSADAVQNAAVTAMPLEGFTSQIAMISDAPPLLVVAIGSAPDRADTLVTVDPVQRKIIDRRPALGQIGRFDR